MPAAGSQHDDRHVAGEFFAPPAPGQLQAAGAGQHPVEQDQVRDLFGDRRRRFATIRRMDRLVPCLAQGKGDHFADRGLVFDDQDAFEHGDSRRRRGRRQ